MVKVWVKDMGIASIKLNGIKSLFGHLVQANDKLVINTVKNIAFLMSVELFIKNLLKIGEFVSSSMYYYLSPFNEEQPVYDVKVDHSMGLYNSDMYKTVFSGGVSRTIDVSASAMNLAVSYDKPAAFATRFTPWLAFVSTAGSAAYMQYYFEPSRNAQIKKIAEFAGDTTDNCHKIDEARIVAMLDDAIANHNQSLWQYYYLEQLLSAVNLAVGFYNMASQVGADTQTKQVAKNAVTPAPLSPTGVPAVADTTSALTPTLIGDISKITESFTDLIPTMKLYLGPTALLSRIYFYKNLVEEKEEYRVKAEFHAILTALTECADQQFLDKYFDCGTEGGLRDKINMIIEGKCERVYMHPDACPIPNSSSANFVDVVGVDDGGEF